MEIVISQFNSCTFISDSHFADESFFNYAKMLSPAALDLELRSLVGLDVLSSFMNALRQRLLSHRDFEAVQAMQNVFIKMHGDVLIANPEVRQDLEGLLSVQEKESQRVLELITSSLGTLGFVRETL
jgi:U3 small nucleolar RNA-associated protein 21